MATEVTRLVENFPRLKLYYTMYGITLKNTIYTS